MARILPFPRLKSAQLFELQRLLRSRSTPTGLRRRSELIWLLAGGASMGRSSLYERAPVGQKIPVIRRSGTFGPTQIRATADLRQRRRHRGNQGSRCPAKRSGTALYDLVATQTARIPEPATRPERDHAIDDPPSASSGGISFL